MIVYSLMPIDFWNGWQRPSDLFRALVDDHAAEWHDPADWPLMWEKAKALALRIGWEGDIREGPYVTVLPGTDGLPPVIIGWKQDNNGTTFVAAPFELPWLAASSDSRAEG